MVAALKGQRSFYSYIYRNTEEKNRAQGIIKQKYIKSGSDKINYIAAKHSLKVRHPKIYNLKLSDEQSLRLNSWSYFGGSMPKVLTEKQKNNLKQNK